MRRAPTAFVFILLLLPVVAFAGIEGTYNCEGTNPGGSGSYKGTVSIIQNGDNYNVTWTIGSQVYIGVGILQGDTFSVGYSDSNKSWFGVVVYKIKGTKLSGPWAMHGGKKNGNETLTKR